MFEADPDNDSLQLSLLHARARVEGEKVYLEVLNDRLNWIGASKFIQDLAIEAAAKALGENFLHEGTKEYSCGGQSHRIAAFRHSATRAVLHLIPGGTFTMGSEPGEDTWAEEYEFPAHEVSISPFLIGRYPVTQELWDLFDVEDQRTSKNARHPINGVNWQNVRDFLENAGSDLRLPSEAEWEYACRSGSKTDWYFGDCDGSLATDSVLNKHVWTATHELGTREVGTFIPNAFGLCDMLGNVWEWCEDLWRDNYSVNPSVSHPGASDSLGTRVIRGGTFGEWNSKPPRSPMREPQAESLTGEGDLGFRLARSIQLGE